VGALHGTAKVQLLNDSDEIAKVTKFDHLQCEAPLKIYRDDGGGAEQSLTLLKNFE